jgi:plasmid replication initiation protein
MEFVLPEWFYRGVVDRSLVLAIDPAYFRLTGGVERWLYRVARKHAGRQRQGWTFDIPHLHQKSGSLATLRSFAFDIRLIVHRQPLPGYRLRIEREGRRELLRILPIDLSTAPVDKSVETLGTSGTHGIGTSGAALSGLREREGQLTLWPERKIRAANLESNIDSNICLRPANVENSSERSRTPKLPSEKNTPDTTFRKSDFTDDATSDAPLPFAESEGRAS